MPGPGHLEAHGAPQWCALGNRFIFCLDSNNCVVHLKTPILLTLSDCLPIIPLSIRGRIRMYAVVRSGGKQYKVSPGDIVRIEKLDKEDGSTVEFGEVLAVNNDQNLVVGS